MLENLRTAMEMVFLLRLGYFPSKNRREFDFFIIAREIRKSDLSLFFANGRGKLFYEIVREVTGQHLIETSTYQQQFWRFSFQQYFSSLIVNCPHCFQLVTFDWGRIVHGRHPPPTRGDLEKWKKKLQNGRLGKFWFVKGAAEGFFHV